MNRFVRCSNCGIKLEIIRKASPQLNEKIIDVISPHNCSEDDKTLADLGIIPDPTPTFVSGKFVQKLDELNKSNADNTLMDRRPKDQVKDSIAPSSVLEMLKKEKFLGDDPRKV